MTVLLVSSVESVVRIVVCHAAANSDFEFRILGFELVLLAWRHDRLYGDRSARAASCPWKEIAMNRLCVLAALASLIGAAGLPAADAKKKEDKKKEDKPPTHKVEKEPFKVELSLKGYFDAKQVEELSLRPEAFTPEVQASLAVIKALEPGTRVKKGDTVVWFDLEKIDQMIRDQESQRSVSDVALRQAVEELPVAERMAPVDLAAAERGNRIAQEDMKKFLEVDRPLAEKNADFSVTSARHSLEYAQEELKQLEKMYRSGDIREETEEIIVRRQRHAVEAAEFHFKNSEIHRDQTLKVELPRQEQNLKENATKQALAFDKAKDEIPLSVNQKRVNVERLKYEQKKLEDRIAKLKRDRESLTVKAPIDGIVYYGKSSRGQWNSKDLESRLLHGGTFSPHEVFVSIVSERPLEVRATAEEKDLRDLCPGMSVEVVPTALPRQKLPGKIERLVHIPSSPGTFDVFVSVDVPTDSPIMAGWACSVKVRAYANPGALTVPTKAIFAETLDEDRHYVYVWTGDKAEKRSVTVGRAAGDDTEITSGLKAGDRVLLEKPKSTEP
jgi:HlyD family secretion protein